MSSNVALNCMPLFLTAFCAPQSHAKTHATTLQMHHNVSYLYLHDDALTGNGGRIHVSICLWLQGEFALFEMAAFILHNILTQFARFNITAQTSGAETKTATIVLRS